MRGGEEGVESNDEDEKGGTRAGDRGGEIEKNYRLQYKQLLHAQKKKKKEKNPYVILALLRWPEAKPIISLRHACTEYLVLISMHTHTTQDLFYKEWKVKRRGG